MRILSRRAWLVVLLSLNVQLATVLPVHAATAQIEYVAVTVPGSLRLCVGATETIHVRIVRQTVVNGQRYVDWVTGGEMLGTVRNGHVGRFDPIDQARPVQAAPQMDADYEFVATDAGHTDVAFTIGHTGEEQRVGSGYRVHDALVPVDVTDCFDAYTSGLATVFDTKDMGDLTKPFYLDGHLATAQVGGLTQFMFFIPSSADAGAYAFVDTAWPLAGPGGRCTAYVSGHYDVVLYGEPIRPTEGDLLMKGSGAAFCKGFSIPIDYTSAPGFQIGFKPRPAP